MSLSAEKPAVMSRSTMSRSTMSRSTMSRSTMSPRTMSRRRGRALLTVLLPALSLGGLAPSPALAGDRQLEILVVNMTPDPVSESASACAKGLRKAIRADYTHMISKGESATRRAVGDTTGEDFMAYTADRLEPLRTQAEERLDAIVLFDCRPENKTFRALVLPDFQATYELRLDRVDLGTSLVATIAEIILRHAWLGFSP